MSEKQNTEDAIFEVILKKGIEKYVEEIENEPDPILTEEELAVANSMKEKIYKDIIKRMRKEKRKNRKAYKKIIILAATISVLAVLLVLNVSAFKNFLVKTYTEIQGDVLKISADYDDFAEKYDSIEKFVSKDELIIPTWLPNNTQLKNVEDNEIYIFLDYKINQNYFNIEEKYIDSKYNIEDLQLEHNTYSVEDITVLDCIGKLITIEYESQLKNYIVVWNTDNVQYIINSNLDKQELDIILKNLKIYKKK